MLRSRTQKSTNHGSFINYISLKNKFILISKSEYKQNQIITHHYKIISVKYKNSFKYLVYAIQTMAYYFSFIFSHISMQKKQPDLYYNIMRMIQKPFMIFIVGTTAVGKTKLSIQLCKAIGGQVVNCDSKQLFKYASIMTAKASPQQMQGVPHHMLDVIQLNQNCYNRNKYFHEAMKCLDDIKSRGKIPVVVGGTNYYLQTLLYDLNLNDPNQEKQYKQQEHEENMKKDEQRITKEQIQKMTKEEKYHHLKQVDPIMGQKLHPNDQNRITSFLIRYAETGVPPSVNYKPYVHKLRFQNSILFWIRNSDKKELHGLMNNRIQKMVDTGGLVEVLTVFKYADMCGLLDGMRMGSLQSIGYKQFEEVYMEIRNILQDQQFDGKKRQFPQIQRFVQGKMKEIKQKISKIESKSIKTHKNVNLLQKCKQILTKNTIDYSKRQITWIRNRLFACQDNINNFFTLELEAKKGNKLDLMQRFDSQVAGKAIKILDMIRQNGLGSIKSDIQQFRLNKHESITEWKKYSCQKCNIQVNGSHQWQQHLNSRRHKEGMTKKQRVRKIREQKKKLTDNRYQKEQKQQNGQKGQREYDQVNNQKLENKSQQQDQNELNQNMSYKKKNLEN